MKRFEETAKLLRSSREKTGMSQLHLAEALNMRASNGQQVSNIERGACGLPPKHAPKVCSILSIEPDVLVEAMAKDYKNAVLEEFRIAAGGAA